MTSNACDMICSLQIFPRSCFQLGGFVLPRAMSGVIPSVESAKRLAAYAAVDRHILPEHKVSICFEKVAIGIFKLMHQIIGIGSGRAVLKVPQRKTNMLLLLQAQRCPMSLTAFWNKARRLTCQEFSFPPVRMMDISTHSFSKKSDHLTPTCLTFYRLSI